MATGVKNVILGDDTMESAYLGDTTIDSMYLGDVLVYSRGEFVGVKLSPRSFSFKYTGGTGTLKVTASTGWTLSYDNNYITVSQASGVSGETQIQITALTNSTQANVDSIITAVTTDQLYSAETTVTIRWNEPFPQKPFMYNYNSKIYVPSTRTFPKKQGQLFDEDLVLDQAPTAVSADCVSLVGSSAVMLKSYNSTSDNPFNRSSMDTELTAIYKVGSCTANTQTLFSSRGTMGYNYMIRGSQFHTSNASFLTYTPSTDPYIMLVRVQANGSCERTVLDANGNVLQTSSSSTINWGSASEAVCFFSEKGYVNAQLFNGVLYWMYLANTALTDNEVLQVINYNESNNVFDTGVTVVSDIITDASQLQAGDVCLFYCPGHDRYVSNFRTSLSTPYCYSYRTFYPASYTHQGAGYVRFDDWDQAGVLKGYVTGVTESGGETYVHFSTPGHFVEQNVERFGPAPLDTTFSGSFRLMSDGSLGITPGILVGKLKDTQTIQFGTETDNMSDPDANFKKIVLRKIITTT